MYSLYVDVARVPRWMLYSPDLKATEKVVWMALAMDAHIDENLLYSPSRLARRIGMDRATVRKAVTRLLEGGWFDLQLTRAKQQIQATPLPTNWVEIPIELIMTPLLNSQAKAIYAVLSDRAGRGFKYSDVGQLMGLSSQTIKCAARTLAAQHWLDIQQLHKQAPICYGLKNPILEIHLAQTRCVQRAIDAREDLGEKLMAGLCVASIDDNHCADRTRPEILKNPKTGYNLELDFFYYRGNVAFEFNGSQHYHATARFSAEEVLEQQKRDRLKAEICQRENIHLIVIQAHELSLEALKEKIGKRLPLRRDGQINRRLLRVLIPACNNYRDNAARLSRRDSATVP